MSIIKPEWVLEESKDEHGLPRLAVKHVATGLYALEVLITLDTLVADRDFANRLVAMMNREGLCG